MLSLAQQPTHDREMLVIVHSGQTGVERGAHAAAIETGLRVAGFMPLERRDELGPLPVDIARRLTECFERGPRPAVKANVAIASGALVLVPDATRPEKFTAIAHVLQAARSAKVPVRAVDRRSDLADVAEWVGALPETCGSTRLLVTGPRVTRWTDGEALARRVVAALAMTW